KLVEMTNGCICCTLRDDLLTEVRRLAGEGRFDYLLIESTGIAEPLPVAATFEFRDEAGASLSDIARLDTMVTVVDTANLLNDYASHDFLKDRGESLGEADDRTLVDLLVDQIEFSDIVVLNKVSVAGPERLDAARKIVTALNPDARIIETDFGKVDPADIFDTGLFDFETAQDHPLWAKELYGFADHLPETEEYGISSFVYRARRPFAPQKIHDVLNGPLPGVIRAKGHFWIATRPDWLAEFSLAGALSTVKPLGIWWATVPQDRWPPHPQARDWLARHWQEPFGDRRQELVFIGSGMDRRAITAALDAALVGDDDRFDAADWRALPDPFPAWRRAPQAA
ncbi:MAG: GTP-binding protein, partial [Pseudodonghicola sp.]